VARRRAVLASPRCHLNGVLLVGNPMPSVLAYNLGIRGTRGK
jgi:hypothetical protein